MIDKTINESINIEETIDSNEDQVPENGEIIDEAVDIVSILTKEKDDLTLLAQRIQADFDNFRKRNASVKMEAYEDGIKDCVLDMLPVLDNLDRALQTPEGSAVDAFASGVAMVLKQFKDALAKMGVEEIPALGELFDPEWHNAIMQEETGEKYRDGEITEVIQKGYKYKGKAIRYSMVKVAVQ